MKMTRRKTKAKPGKVVEQPTKYMALDSFHVANIIRAIKGEVVELKGERLVKKLKGMGLIRDLGGRRI